MNSKESGKVRYAYGVAMALLLGGTAFSIASGPVGAQVAQNAPGSMSPRPGAPLSFADLAARLQPAVVNISTKQRVPVTAQQTDPFEEFFRRFGSPQGRRRRRAGSRRAPAKPARWVRASSSRPTATSSPTTIWWRHQRLGHGRHRHRHLDQPQGIYRADRRPRPDLRPRSCSRSKAPTCRTSISATAPAAGSATG